MPGRRQGGLRLPQRRSEKSAERRGHRLDLFRRQIGAGLRRVAAGSEERDCDYSRARHPLSHRHNRWGEGKRSWPSVALVGQSLVYERIGGTPIEFSNSRRNESMERVSQRPKRAPHHFLLGRGTSSPPQFGQTPLIDVAHDSQNVHSKEQTNARPFAGVAA